MYMSPSQLPKQSSFNNHEIYTVYIDTHATVSKEYLNLNHKQP